MEKTVKASEEKMITARELFSMTYGTRELYTDEKIDAMKKRILEKFAKKREKLSVVEFYENDGVIFYASANAEKGGEFTSIDYIKDYTAESTGELWRFGFFNKKTGKITLLFGGHSIAKGKSEVFKYFEITKVVTTSKYKNAQDLVPFAHKD
jgi:hypothetical protein